MSKNRSLNISPAKEQEQVLKSEGRESLFRSLVKIGTPNKIAWFVSLDCAEENNPVTREYFRSYAEDYKKLGDPSFQEKILRVVKKFFKERQMNKLPSRQA